LSAIKPRNSSDFGVSSGPLIDRIGSFFSISPVSLRTSGLRQRGTVLEIRMSREGYEFEGSGFSRSSWTGENIRFVKSLDRGSNPASAAIDPRLIRLASRPVRIDPCALGISMAARKSHEVVFHNNRWTNVWC